MFHGIFNSIPAKQVCDCLYFLSCFFGFPLVRMAISPFEIVHDGGEKEWRFSLNCKKSDGNKIETFEIDYLYCYYYTNLTLQSKQFHHDIQGTFSCFTFVAWLAMFCR